MAGKIGSADQVKVTVFGPVVNLASRLEGMTKLLRVPILLDEATAAQLRAAGSACPGRLRRLAMARPYGLATALTVTELRPPAVEDHLLTEAHLATHEAALEAFIRGDWTTALERLYQLPPRDQGMDFLMSFILSHQRTPPPGWDGVIPMESKG